MLIHTVAEAVLSMSEGNKFTLLQGDCLKLLKALPEESVSLIVSSPPYFMGKEYDKSTRQEDFADENAVLAPLLSRVLRPGGSLCWQTGVHVQNGAIAPLDFIAHAHFSKDRSLFLRNRIVWHFEHGFHSRKRFCGRYETILWYTKGESYHFNLDAVRVPQKYPGKRHYKGPNKGQISGNPMGKNPGDVWTIPNVKSKHPEKTVHPCQFPVAIPQRLIRALTSPGDVVLDPFAGVSSTGIAAVMEKRSFVGCEIDAKYAEAGFQRYQALLNGTLLVRGWNKPVAAPDPRQSVAQLPPNFVGYSKPAALHEC